MDKQRMNVGHLLLEKQRNVRTFLLTNNGPRILLIFWYQSFMAPYDQDENKQGWDQTKWTLYHNHLAEEGSTS